ncbi:hypothetical protein M0R45_005819 [Rubus argutus]|uniref:Uncharacterized protein n=1 Tax=Rubus argutus TaxID=59490 RepID=A0AAW1YNP6_RUBAR
MKHGGRERHGSGLEVMASAASLEKIDRCRTEVAVLPGQRRTPRRLWGRLNEWARLGDAEEDAAAGHGLWWLIEVEEICRREIRAGLGSVVLVR